MNQILPILTSIVMLTFVGIIFKRWMSRRRAPLLVWGTGLAMFAAASMAEVFLDFGWNSTVFRSWYLFGAMLNAAWIGQGTVFLLARRPVANATLIVLAVVSAIGVYGVLTVPLNAAGFDPNEPLSTIYRQTTDAAGNVLHPGILPQISDGGWVRLLTIPFNIYGTIALVGGALYSAWLFWRKKSLLYRMWGNVLIAAGALVVANAGTMTRLGIQDLLYVGELAGGSLIFAGFLVATRRVEEPAPARQVAASVARSQRG